MDRGAGPGLASLLTGENLGARGADVSRRSGSEMPGVEPWLCRSLAV